MVIKRNILVALLLTLIGADTGAQLAPAIPELIEVSDSELQSDTGAQLAGALENYRSHLGQDDAEALEAAKEVVSLSVQLWGDADTRVSQALTNLAIAQVNVGNHDIARQNFMASIRTAEIATNSIVTPLVINPLRGLATALVALNKAEMAIPVFERAIHVSHVNEGPNNVNQLPVMKALSSAHFFSGDPAEADSLQDNIYRLQQRQFDVDSDEYLDALTERARWYTRTGNFTEATEAYRRIERVISREHSPDDVRLIEPLLELSFILPRQQFGDVDYLSAMKISERAASRAVQIARVHDSAQPGLLAHTTTRLGDWHMANGFRRKARMHYREAWELMEADPALHVLRDELFARPVPVVVIQLKPVFGQETNRAILSSNRPADRGFVEVSFDVNAYGEPVNIELLDSEPPGIMETHVIRGLRRYVYRPVFVDGDPVAYNNITMRHEFRYDQERLTNSDKAAIERARRERAERLAAADPDAENVRQ